MFGIASSPSLSHFHLGPIREGHNEKNEKKNTWFPSSSDLARRGGARVRCRRGWAQPRPGAAPAGVTLAKRGSGGSSPCHHRATTRWHTSSMPRSRPASIGAARPQSRPADGACAHHRDSLVASSEGRRAWLRSAASGRVPKMR